MRVTTFPLLVVFALSRLFQIAECFLPSPAQCLTKVSSGSAALSSTANTNVELDRRSAIALGSIVPLSLLVPRVAKSAEIAGNDNSNRAPIPSWKLSGGVEFPVLALNTAGLSVDDTYEAIRTAKQEGISHIDFHPGDERDGVARYLSVDAGNRESYFLTTKIRKAPSGTSPKDAASMARIQIEDDLKILNVKYVDMLMLRDSPDPEVIQAQWKVLEEALSQGKTRSIGVVNYCQSALKSVMKTAKVVPSVNYIMVHVGMGKDACGLRTFGEDFGIRTFSYGQTGEPKPSPDILYNPILRHIGKEHGGKTPCEVALRWVLQNNMAASIRPSSNFGSCNGDTCKWGITRQAHSFDWRLTERQMAELDALTSPVGNPTLFSSAGCPGAFGT